MFWYLSTLFSGPPDRRIIPSQKNSGKHRAREPRSSTHELSHENAHENAHGSVHEDVHGNAHEGWGLVCVKRTRGSPRRLPRECSRKIFQCSGEIFQCSRTCTRKCARSIFTCHIFTCFVSWPKIKKMKNVNNGGSLHLEPWKRKPGFINRVLVAVIFEVSKCL